MSFRDSQKAHLFITTSFVKYNGNSVFFSHIRALDGSSMRIEIEGLYLIAIRDYVYMYACIFVCKDFNNNYNC